MFTYFSVEPLFDVAFRVYLINDRVGVDLRSGGEQVNLAHHWQFTQELV